MAMDVGSKGGSSEIDLELGPLPFSPRLQLMFLTKNFR